MKCIGSLVGIDPMYTKAFQPIPSYFGVSPNAKLLAESVFEGETTAPTPMPIEERHLEVLSTVLQLMSTYYRPGLATSAIWRGTLVRATRYFVHCNLALTGQQMWAALKVWDEWAGEDNFSAMSMQEKLDFVQDEVSTRLNMSQQPGDGDRQKSLFHHRSPSTAPSSATSANTSGLEGNDGEDEQDVEDPDVTQDQPAEESDEGECGGSYFYH